MKSTWKKKTIYSYIASTALDNYVIYILCMNPFSVLKISDNLSCIVKFLKPNIYSETITTLLISNAVGSSNNLCHYMSFFLHFASISPAHVCYTWMNFSTNFYIKKESCLYCALYKNFSQVSFKCRVFNL